MTIASEPDDVEKSLTEVRQIFGAKLGAGSMNQ